ncbi:MAG: hypothetical protein LBS01_04285 [Prevotellaceae bacterium]|jgi:RNA polymerase sigma factor (sigma-70 family)|nr:hypothetical protein [Prevotellaceae bacterium]
MVSDTHDGNTTEWFTNEELAYIKARVQHYAFKLKRRSCLQGESIQDLKQDLLLAVLEAWKGFDRESRRLEPFVEEVLKYACKNILRDTSRQKRQISQFSANLDDVPENLLEDKADNWIEEVEQKIDVERYLRKAPVFLRKIMVELQTDSLRNVAKKFGISRAYLRKLVGYCCKALAPLKELVSSDDFLALRKGRHLCR